MLGRMFFVRRAMRSLRQSRYPEIFICATGRAPRVIDNDLDAPIQNAAELPTVRTGLLGL